jgi:hypothetical protein
MPLTSLHDVACTSATLRIGNKSHLVTKRGSISVPSSKKPTSNTSHQEQSLQSNVGSQSNRFAGLTTNKDSDNDTADKIAGTISLHMVNLTAQTTATLNEHATQMNASLQQLAANTAQLHQRQ